LDLVGWSSSRVFAEIVLNGILERLGGSMSVLEDRQRQETIRETFPRPNAAISPEDLSNSKLGNANYLRVKRILDVALASVGIVVLSPVLLLVSLGIVATDGAPIIFRHERVGRNGRMFKILKFRSMRKDAQDILDKNPELKKKFEENYKLDDDPRITRIGKFIRATSLDELPQLFNVLKGDMSLVGPRPIIVPELERYGESQDIYLALTPGCTGLWQCSGRSDTSYEERVRLDSEYALKASVRLDLMIILKTVPAVLARRGAK
jgi:lipopolysaccharide/colanic/teichoic acid biosynthesis glycosyltransferase